MNSLITERQPASEQRGEPPSASTASLRPASAVLSRLAWLALALGGGLRVFQYLLNRSLWLDEAYLALNILHRSFSALLQPLSYHQGAPVLFLMAEKEAVRFFGPGEYSLRLLPLLAGLASLFLFFAIARHILTPRAAAIAVALFALSPPVIYYASETKQYSCDVAVALLLSLFALVRTPNQWGQARIVVLGCLGALAIWISHAAVFVVAGIGLAILVPFLARKDWRQAARFLPAFFLWTASLAASYLLVLRPLTGDKELLNYWVANFMPLLPRSVSDLKWFYDAFFGFFTYTASFEFAGLAALAFIVGAAAFYRRNRYALAVLLLPALFTLLASAFHKYPFGGRLALFLVPAVLIMIGNGIDQAMLATRERLPLAGYVLLLFLLLDPAVYLFHHFAKPHTLVPRPGIMLPEEIKPVMAYVHRHEAPGDLVYLFPDAAPAYQYYDEIDGARETNLVVGTASGDRARQYVQDLNRLRGHRVWVVLSHFNGYAADDAKYIRFYLDASGRFVDSFSSAGAGAYLYDLSPMPPSPETLPHR